MARVPGEPLSSLGEVAAELRRIADLLPIALLGEATDHVEEAAAIMAEVSVGTNQPDLEQATGIFTEAHHQARDLLLGLIALRGAIHTIADNLVNTGTGSISAPPEPNHLLDKIRNSLPEGVDGTQTQGRWLGPGTDVTVLRSGKGDEWYDKALAFIKSVEGPKSPVTTLAVHVEVKLAVRMREENRRHEIVIIDRKVCGRRPFDRDKPLTCDRLLKRFLRPGTTLTVIERDGTRVTYRGLGS